MVFVTRTFSAETLLDPQCLGVYAISAEGAVLLLAWGNAPGCLKPRALKARFTFGTENHPHD
jgi:hypothetical protein